MLIIYSKKNNNTQMHGKIKIYFSRVKPEASIKDLSN